MRKGASHRASSVHETQKAAVERARDSVRRAGGGEIVIHAPDGRIRDSDTVFAGPRYRSRDPESGQIASRESPAARPEAGHQHPPVLSVVWLVDLSDSMAGRIDVLTRTLEDTVEELRSSLGESAEMAMIGYGGRGAWVLNIAGEPTATSSVFVPLPDVRIPRLVAGGHSPLDAGLNLALDVIHERGEASRGRERFRPPIVVLTDGVPRDTENRYRANLIILTDGVVTDDEGSRASIRPETMERLRRTEAEGRARVYVVASGRPDIDALEQLAPHSTIAVLGDTASDGPIRIPIAPAADP